MTGGYIIERLFNVCRRSGDFSILQNTSIRDKFWNDYVSLLNQAEFDIISIYFDDDKMNHLQHGRTKNNYNIGFHALLDNFMHYLVDKNAYGQICVESRSFNENRFLLDVFYKYQNNGSIYFTEDNIRQHLSSMGFTIKGDNCIGLQLVDPIPSQLMRYKAGDKKDFHSLSQSLSKKIYHSGTIYENILGIKNIFE